MKQIKTSVYPFSGFNPRSPSQGDDFITMMHELSDKMAMRRNPQSGWHLEGNGQVWTIHTKNPQAIIRKLFPSEIPELAISTYGRNGLKINYKDQFTNMVRECTLVPAKY